MSCDSQLLTFKKSLVPDDSDMTYIEILFRQVLIFILN